MTHDEYKDLREKWTHEDNLINHRLGWLLTSQTILFAGYGVLLQKQQIPQERVSFMLTLIAGLGAVTSALLLLSVVAAIVALFALRKCNQKLNPDGIAFLLGIVTPIGLPLVFFVAWIVLFFRH